MKALKVQLPSAVTDPSLRKLEHYYGIEFERGASNGGGANGYHAMIGDAELLSNLTFHNLIKTAMVKNGAVVDYLNEVNWNQTASGASSTIDGTDGSDIMQTMPTLYAILGGSNPTYERYIISDQYFEYDGDAAVEINAHGESPDYETVWNGVSRSIYNENVAGSMGAGLGTNYSDPGFGNANGYGFPKTSLNRFQYESYARAKNENINSNLPYTNISGLDLELDMALMYIEFRTKNLNKLLGHGISSNVAPNASTWGTVSGVRVSPVSDFSDNVTYLTFGQNLYISGSAQVIWKIINGQNPLLKIFEPQLGVSGGGTLESVVDADGNTIQGISNGVMTGIWKKQFTFQVANAGTTAAQQVVMYVQVQLCQPIWRGKTRLYGHLWQHYSGYEVLNTLEGEVTHNYLYRAPSIAAMTTDTEVSKSSAESFGFESSYDLITDLGASSGWCKETAHDLSKGICTAVPKVVGGGSISTYESAYLYTKVGTSGYKNRCCSFFGLHAPTDNAALRSCTVFTAPSHSGSPIGSGFRVNL